MKLQITEHGRRRVASDDFAKTMAHVVRTASEGRSTEDAFGMVFTYVASALMVDAGGTFALPSDPNEMASAMSEFIRENDGAIRKAIHSTMESPAFLMHCFEMYKHPIWAEAAEAMHLKAFGGRKAN